MTLFAKFRKRLYCMTSHSWDRCRSCYPPPPPTPEEKARRDEELMRYSDHLARLHAKGESDLDPNRPRKFPYHGSPRLFG